MTTFVVNNLIFRGFFEKQKLTGPNFIDWLDSQLGLYHSGGLVRSYLEAAKFPPAPVPISMSAVSMLPPEAFALSLPWAVKRSKEIAGIMLMTMEPKIQLDLENLSAYEMLHELKTLFVHKAYQGLPFRNPAPLVLCFAAKVQPASIGIKKQNPIKLRVKIKGRENNLSLYGLIPKPKIPPSTKRGKNNYGLSVCHQCWVIHVIGRGKRNCPQNLAKLLKNMKLSQGASGSGPQGHDMPQIEHELGDLGEPANYKAALLDPESDKWLNAMNVEMQSMKDNEVWDLVDLPPNGKTIGSKWLFKKKTDMDRVVYTFKARLVAKGFTQTYVVDYEETFSPVADIRAIRILIDISAYYDYEIWQMDVKTAFLNGHLSEEVYMKQPEGFVNPKYPNRKFGFTQNHDEPCVHLKASGSNVTFLIFYVDDILIMGNNIPMLQDVKSYLGRCFAMKDLGEAAYILGIKIYKDRSWRLIGASTPSKLKRMQNVSYALAVGFIMYVTIVKNILKYLGNTKDMFLVYGGDIKRELRVSYYTDVGYLTDTDDLKSQIGYVFILNRGVEAVCVRKFISRLGVVPTIEEPINMYCDNTRAITIANESGITKGARHFRAKVHYLREVIEYGYIKLEKVHTDNNLADPFTKALAFPKHSEHTRNIGMLPANISCKSVFY
ncbi:retrotransposon protein, putative, ty1-copia subclass [Tanacetum coccineum]